MAGLPQVSKNDELVSDFAIAAAEVANEPAESYQDEDDLSPLDSADEEDVPAHDNFWDKDDNSQEDASTDENSRSSDELSGDEDEPAAAAAGGFLTVKINGVDTPISREEAIKQLSLVGGARKAFSDRAKIQRELDTHKGELEQLRKFKESWDKLEDLKHDPEKLYEVVSGKPWADFKKEQEEAAKLYAEATPAERVAMDQEARVRNMERSLDRERRQRERETNKAKADRDAAENAQLQTSMEREFHKYDFPIEDQKIKAKVSKMFWNSAVDDLKQYYKDGYAMSPKLLAHVFKTNASALQGFYGKSVDQAVSKVTKAKAESATKKAQLSSARNYTAPTKDNTKGDPLTVFQRMFRGGK